LLRREALAGGVESDQRLHSRVAPGWSSSERAAMAATLTRCARSIGFRREVRMPFVNIKLIEGVLSSEQKRQLIERVTEAMVSVEGERMRSLTTVVIDDVKSGDWGIGGRAATTEMVKDVASGKVKPPG
jgi:4-oxalocrotonate tautomerase